MNHDEERSLMRTSAQEFRKFVLGWACQEEHKTRSVSALMHDAPLMSEDGVEKYRTLTIVLISEEAGFQAYEGIREKLLTLLKGGEP